MKIEVAKSDLESALQVVSIGTSGSGTDLTTHFVFRTKDDQTSVLSYNGRLGASIPFVCNASTDEGDDAPDAFTIESWRLQQWLKAVDDAALTLELDGGIVSATSPSGTVQFRSLDPSAFPFWDKTLKAAKKTMTIEARRFHAALSHVKSFVSSADTTRPEMAVTEARDGSLWATDTAALTIVTLEEFEKTNLRIHGKDIPSVLSFLLLVGDAKVEVLEHKRSLFIQRDDGGVLSVGRPTTAFLELEDIEDVEDSHWWNIGTKDLDRAIQQLSASAAKEDFKITFNFDPGARKVLTSMTADSGSTITLDLECPEYGSKEEAEIGLPKDGWDVEYPYLQRILSSYRGGKTLKFGLNPAEEGGWTRFVEDREGDKYLTILVWIP